MSRRRSHMNSDLEATHIHIWLVIGKCLNIAEDKNLETLKIEESKY